MSSPNSNEYGYCRIKKIKVRQYDMYLKCMLYNCKDFKPNKEEQKNKNGIRILRR